MAKVSARKAMLAGGAAIALVMTATPAIAQQRKFDLPAQSATRSIPEFARQAGIQVIAPGAKLRGLKTPPLRGTYDVRDGLRQLIAGTGLQIVADEGSTITLGPSAEKNAVAAADAASTGDEDGSSRADAKAVADILVVGRRTLNTDIPRSEDDAQPYVVFDQRQIAKSGATTLETFLQSQLPMNAQTFMSQQGGIVGGASATTGRVNLRGLGTSQTLILVDGHRLPNIHIAGSFAQPNLNGIPTSAIDRIEVLPATASGIYGGGATGGVVNIILKRNYSGLDITASYEDTTDLKAGLASLEISGGVTLEHGKTHLMFGLSRATNASLSAEDRDFYRKRERLLAQRDHSTFFAIGRNICPSTSLNPDFASCANVDLVLDNGTSLNSNRAFVPSDYPGAAVAGDGGSAFLSTAGQVDLSAAKPIWQSPTTTSVTFNGRRQFFSGVEAYFDFSKSVQKAKDDTPLVASVVLPADSLANPFQQDILAFVPIPGLNTDLSGKLTTTSVGAGLIVRLPFHWSAGLDYRWSKNETSGNNQSIDSSVSYTPEGLALLQTVGLTDLSTQQRSDLNSLFHPSQATGPSGETLASYSLRLSGPIFRLPGGAVTVTALAEHRPEKSRGIVRAVRSFFFWDPPASRVVNSEYLELRAPVLSPSNKVPLVNSLELMAAVRHDYYNTKFRGSTIIVPSLDGPFPETTSSVNKLKSTDYTLGLRYAPIPDLFVRASYGTGFLPPDLGQIRPNVVQYPPFFAAILYGLTSDPRRGGTPLTGDPTTHLLSLNLGGNTDLRAEESNSLSVGAVLTPQFLGGFRVSVDYTRIRKSGEIAGNLGGAYLLAHEDDLPGMIVRAPTQPGDPPDYAGPITFVNLGLVNFAKTRMEAYDFQADYNLKTGKVGDWHFYTIGTYTRRLARQGTPDQPLIDSVGFYNGPSKWRANFGIDWSLGQLTVGWNAQYYDKSNICLPGASTASSLQTFCDNTVQVQQDHTIPTQLYNDFYVKYNADSLFGVHGAELFLGIENAFNRKPPILVPSTTLGYSGFADPRLRRFVFTLRSHL